jgi:hypothetical protein
VPTFQPLRELLAASTLGEQLLRLSDSVPLTAPGPSQSGCMGIDEHDGTGDRVIMSDNAEFGRRHRQSGGRRVLSEETLGGAGHPVDPPPEIHGAEEVSFIVRVQPTVDEHTVSDYSARSCDKVEVEVRRLVRDEDGEHASPYWHVALQTDTEKNHRLRPWQDSNLRLQAPEA